MMLLPNFDFCEGLHSVRNKPWPDSSRGLCGLVNFFRFYVHLTRRASAKFMHFIKYVRIRASEENL